MADKRYDQFTQAIPVPSNITLFADPATGALNKIALSDLFELNQNGGSLLSILQGLGSPVKSFNLNIQHMGAYNRTLVFQNSSYWFLNYLPACTVTGVWYGFDTVNAITAINFNGFALYSIAGTALTRIAKTANDPSFFTGTTNVFRQAAFTAPVTITAGIYYLSLLSCSSANTSRCMLYANAWYNNPFLTRLGMTNSNQTSATMAAQTDLASTNATTNFTDSLDPIPLMGLY